MAIAQEFVTLPLGELRATAHRMKDEGYRFIQTHAVYNEPDVDLYYSFMKDGKVTNWRIEGVTKEDAVPSITDIFLAAFVFENEARELFGVDMRDIAIDFQGALYAPAEFEPMRVITPEQKAAIEKARKAAALKDAKKSQPASAGTSGNESVKRKGFVLTPEKREKLEAKLATMAADKVAKVREALAAREAEAAGAPAGQETPAGAPAAAEKVEKKAAEAVAEQAADVAEPAKETVQNVRDVDLEAKIALLDPAKAEKVRAALAARAGVVDAPSQATEPIAVQAIDAEIAAKLKMMQADKAERVRAALARHASLKGGE